MVLLKGEIKQSQKADIEENSESGFSLVELTFVIVIIAVVISTIVFTTQARLEVARIFTTKERMQIISDSIERYVERYGHLPCPAQYDANRLTDNDYGWATGSDANYSITPAGNCAQAEELYDSGNGDVVRGMVPIRSLIPALDGAMAVDGWGNRFAYIIAENFSVRENYAGTGTNTSTEIRIANHPDKGSGYIGYDIQDAIYILLSHGPNGHGARKDKNPSVTINASNDSATDRENVDSDQYFSQSMPYGDFYDDIMIIGTRWRLPDPIN